MSAYHKDISRPKIVAVVGPTATGKSDLAVDVALAFNGEVVSADSRQVYRGLDIGTGKITAREMRGVRHHLLDVASPRRQFSVARYQRLADKAIAGIFKRGKLPILCGGTGFYIDAVVDGIVLPDVPPDTELRQSLSRTSTGELTERLSKLDPKRAETVDPANPRRLIRAIEIAEALGAVPKPEARPRYDTLMLGLALPDDILRLRIRDRLKKRLRLGLIAEVRDLHAGGLSWRRLDALGLEYRCLSEHLQGKLSRKELETVLEQKIWQYAKRQKTWFKRDERIRWFPPSEYRSIETQVQKFLSA